MGKRIYQPFAANDPSALRLAAAAMQRQKEEWLGAPPTIDGLQPVTAVSDNLFRIYRIDNRLSDDLIFQFWSEFADAILKGFFDTGHAVFDLFERKQRVTSGSLKSIIKGSGWSYSLNEKGPVHVSYVTDLWATIRTWNAWTLAHHYPMPADWQRAFERNSAIDRDAESLRSPKSKKASPKLALAIETLNRLQLPTFTPQKERYERVHEDLAERGLQVSQRTLNDAWTHYANAKRDT